MSTPTLEDPERLTLRQIAAPGLAGLRAHWPQFFLFQLLALGLVIAYFRSPTMHAACERLSALKHNWGLVFAATSTLISGFFFPEMAKLVLGSHSRISLRLWPSTILLFILVGILTDVQYRILGWTFGGGMDFGTAVRKMLADQFLLTPAWGVPYWIFAYALRANRWRVGPTLRMMSLRWYTRSVLPLLLPAWCFWIPMTLMIYSLPGPLQFSLFSLAMAAWSLIMLFVAAKSVPTA